MNTSYLLPSLCQGQCCIFIELIYIIAEGYRLPEVVILLGIGRGKFFHFNPRASRALKHIRSSRSRAKLTLSYRANERIGRSNRDRPTECHPWLGVGGGEYLLLDPSTARAAVDKCRPRTERGRPIVVGTDYDAIGIHGHRHAEVARVVGGSELLLFDPVGPVPPEYVG